MARRRKKGGSRKKGIRIAATAGMVLGMWNLYGAYKEGGAHRAMVSLTGYDPNHGWNWKWATSTIPMVAGCAVSMVASKAGLNRYTPTRINI